MAFFVVLGFFDFFGEKLRVWREGCRTGGQEEYDQVIFKCGKHTENKFGHGFRRQK